MPDDPADDPPDDDRPDDTEAALAAIAAATRSEKRGIDFLKRSEEELEAIEAALDPAELAELSMWFSRPSREVVEEQIEKIHREPVTEDEILDEEFRQRQVKIAAASKAIEPWMIHLLERHTGRGDAIIHELPPLKPVVDERIFRVRPLTADEIADAREYSRSGEIDDCLAENVPQAVLRDLYRAETEFALRLQSPYEEPPPDDGRAEVQAALREDYRPPRLQSFYEIVLDARKLFAELIAGSWPEKVAAVKARHEAEA